MLLRSPHTHVLLHQGSSSSSTAAPLAAPPLLLSAARSARCVSGRQRTGGAREQQPQHVCSGYKQQSACIISVDPLEPKQVICDGLTCRVPVILTAVTAIAAAYYYKRQAELPKKKLPEPWPEIPEPGADPEAYQKALARTRQAQCVQRAIGYMRAGESARSMVELHKALEENSSCRSPLLEGHQSHEELTGLYKQHIQNTEVPPNFAVLLQLRELLGIATDEAEALEKDVLKEAAAFSI